MIQQRNTKKFFLELFEKLSTEEYEEVFSGIIWEIKTMNHARIGVNTDDDIPLKKPLKFLMLTKIIRCVFQEVEALYSQSYLDECLYEL